jgi:hypothetical protein
MQTIPWRDWPQIVCSATAFFFFFFGDASTKVGSDPFSLSSSRAVNGFLVGCPFLDSSPRTETMSRLIADFSPLLGSRIHPRKLVSRARVVSLPTMQVAIARMRDDFPDPLLPVKTVHPAYTSPPLSRSNSKDSKPRIFFKEILLMYTDGFPARKTLAGILHESRTPRRGPGAATPRTAFCPSIIGA